MVFWFSSNGSIAIIKFDQNYLMFIDVLGTISGLVVLVALFSAVWNSCSIEFIHSGDSVCCLPCG